MKTNILRTFANRLTVIGSCIMVLGLTSCNDELELKPQGEFTADQLTDESIEGLLSAAYQGLEAHFFDNNNAAFAGPITNWIFDVRSDDAYKGGEGVSMENNIHQLEISYITTDNPSCFNKWENNYLGIARVHKAMTAIKESNISDKEPLLGELKVLRAWFYFDLNRIFKSIPYFTEDDDPKTIPNGNLSKAEIFDRIKQDLIEAYSVLPENQSQPGRFNKYVAAALMAKVCAFTSDWEDVETYSNYVINSNKYELYDNYGDMSKLEFNNKKESIMAIQFSTANDNIHINFCNLLNTTRSEGNVFGNGDDFFLASQNLVNAFRVDGNGLPLFDTFNDVKVITHDESGDNTARVQAYVDPRLDFTVGRIGMPFRGKTYSKAWCRDFNTYGEYSGKKGLIDPDSPDMVQGFPWGASGLNFNLIRYADILLLKAEALIEQNKNLDEARNLINAIREKAQRSIDTEYTPQELNTSMQRYNVGLYPATGWNQDYARKAVRFERRLELAMEGNRWFDLVRWGTAVSTINKYMQEEKALRPYYDGAAISEDELYFPVPLSQIENSNGLYHN